MESKIKTRPFKKWCLKIKLKQLESKRDREILSFIESHPSQAAKLDDLTNYIHTANFKELEHKIKALRRLIRITYKN